MVANGVRCLLAAALLGGCASEAGLAGDVCQRSSQCEPGLACIEGHCDDDLSALADQSVVPELMPEPEDAGQDAGQDASVPDPDQDGG